MNNLSHKPQISIIEISFLNAIFSKTLSLNKGFLEIRIKHQGLWSTQYFNDTNSRLIEFLSNAPGDIYFGVAPRNEKQSTKSAIKNISCLWLDLDWGPTGHNKRNRHATKEKALIALNTFSIPPSYIVSSGNGFHVYWLLSEPYPVSNPEEIEGILKYLITALGGDPGTHDIGRILRIPGTFNLKDPSNPKRVDIISDHTENEYSLEVFKKKIKSKHTMKDGAVESTDSHINKDARSLSLEAQKLIFQGHCNAGEYPSRSEADYRVICEMVKRDWPDKKIIQVFDTYPIGEKHRENKHYLGYSIRKARQAIELKFDPTVSALPLSAFHKGTPVAGEVACYLATEYQLININDTIYQYEDGYYKQLNDRYVERLILQKIGNLHSYAFVKNILNLLKAQVVVENNTVNSTPWLNVNNGLLNPFSLELCPHDPKIISTIRVAVTYDQEANSKLWENTLKEIFPSDTQAITLIQEFFGLCLTKETKFNKCLYLIGEGANGKSVILNTLKNLVGPDNSSAIPLEKFSNTHYLANLFGRLVNICLETPSKAEIYDSTFKAVTSGEEITADHKYGKPFSFKPICKLSFAVNNMPRIDDKTDGFFRRLLIIRLNRQFTESEQNKNLENELQGELSGILNWALIGLERLMARGHFEESIKMRKEIEQYRKENNSILLFVEEKCDAGSEFFITKKALFYEYVWWCKENNNLPLSQCRFSKELSRAYPKLESRKTNIGHNWYGIKLRDQNEIDVLAD